MDLLLQLKGVTKTFRKRTLWKAWENLALSGLTLDVSQGETLGLVGESGSGKTTAGRIILGLTKPTSGQVFYRGQEITDFSTAGLRDYRKKVTGLFQDPSGTLNPRMTVGDSISEVVSAHNRCVDPRERSVELLEMAQLAHEVYHAYPQELSGGQRQRAGLARCLALRPELLVCDEPVASLDISVQAQVLKVFRELQLRKNLAYLFISHDLRVIRYISHKVAVLYRGRLLEVAPVDVFFNSPGHPYSNVLLASMPKLNAQRAFELPDPKENHNSAIDGCPYFPNCRERTAICGKSLPPMKEVAGGHWVRCFG